MKNFFRTEWAKLREMNFTDKRQYIWEYYKLHIFAFALVAFFVGSLVNSLFINPPKEEYLYIAWIGIPVHPQQLEMMGYELNTIVENPQRQHVMIADYTMTDNPQINMALNTRFFALLQIGSLDFFLTTREGVEDLATEGFLQPMGETMSALAYLNPSVYSQVAQRLVTISFTPRDAEASRTDAMAISLAEIPFFESFYVHSENMYLSMVVNASRFEATAKALEVFFDGA